MRWLALVVWLGAMACGGRSLVDPIEDSADASGGTASGAGGVNTRGGAGGVGPTGGTIQGGSSGTTSVSGAGGAPSGGSSPGGTSARGGSAGAGGRGGGSGIRPASCSAGEFCLVAPALTANQLKGVWGSGRNDVWAVGARGTILHYDGSWQAVESGTTANLMAVSGTSATDVWFVGRKGTVIHYDGAEFDDSRGPATELDVFDVAAVGEEVWLAAMSPPERALQDAVFHFDGTHWEAQMPSTLLDVNYLALWANAPDDVWMVSAIGMFHYDDSNAWSEVARVVGSDVWAEPGREPWFTLWNQVMLVDGNTSRTYFTGDESLNLYGIWGDSEFDKWVVGSGGFIAYGQQGDFSVQASPTDQTLYSVWGTSPSNVWAVGDNGTIIHYDGSAWSLATPDRGPNDTVSFTGISGFSDDEQWIVGKPGVVSRFDGVSPPVDVPVSGSEGKPYTAITGELRDNFAMVGVDGRIAEFDGETWSAVPSPVSYPLNAMWMTSPSTWLAVGDEGAIRRTSDGVWIREPDTGAEGALRAVWGAYDQEYWVGGDSVVFGHLHDGAWLPVETMVYGSRGIWGWGASDIWSVSFEMVAHYDGTSWAVDEAFLSDYGMTAIAGCDAEDVWVVGLNGNIWHYDGSDWARFESGTTNHLRAVRCSPGGVWVVGDGGVVARYAQ